MEEYISFVIHKTGNDEEQTEALNALLNKIGIRCTLRNLNEEQSLLEIRSDLSSYIRSTNRHAGRIAYIDRMKEEVLKYLNSHTVKDTSLHFQIPERTLYRALKRWRKP